MFDIGADDLEVTEDGDKATVTRKDDADEPLNLVRKDGKWYIDPEGMLGDSGEMTAEALEKRLEQTAAMVKVYEDLADKAGEDGMTAEKLKAALMEAMMAAMMGGEE